jgi:hypothetical protein
LIPLVHRSDDAVVGVELEKVPGHQVETHEYEDDKEEASEDSAHAFLCMDEPAIDAHG